MGVRDHKTVLYGPDWVQIQDDELINDFKDMDIWIGRLFNTDKIEAFRGNMDRISKKITLNNIQHGAIKVRDFATGVAVNAAIALAAPQAAANLAVDTATGAVKSFLLEMLIPKPTFGTWRRCTSTPARPA